MVSATYVLDNQAQLAGFICESFAFQVPAPGFAGLPDIFNSLNARLERLELIGFSRSVQPARS